MLEKKVKIPTMTCSHCVMHIKDEADKTAGAKVKDINMETKEVTFSLEKQEDWTAVSKNLEEIGYPAEDI
jgi:copper chaperone CopZ